jgi:pimeloyl-ACP methyl ester carboxylesterase
VTSIVFAHGIWADGSCFSKVIPPLRAAGYEVITSQHSLDSLAGDVDTVLHTVGRVTPPVLLVGHSYGGTLITKAVDDRVAGLVYMAALGPDESETSQGQQDKFPKTDVFDYVAPANGKLWMLPDGVPCFAGDLTEAEQQVAFATHIPPVSDLFDLLVPIERAGVGQHLNSHVVTVTVDVGDRRRGHLVDECGGVLAEHGDVGDLLDEHEGRGPTNYAIC